MKGAAKRIMKREVGLGELKEVAGVVFWNMGSNRLFIDQVTRLQKTSRMGRTPMVARV